MQNITSQQTEGHHTAVSSEKELHFNLPEICFHSKLLKVIISIMILAVLSSSGDLFSFFL